MEVKPFKAFRFNADVVGDVGKCIAPPYDVITDAQRDELWRGSKYNIVHITKGRTEPGDNEQNNQYVRAADYLKTWIAEGALRQDEQETIYGYVQDFDLGGTAFQRLSFIALAKLEDFGKIVRPHEQVFEKPMQDRLNLERATAAKFGLVFMLYDDPQGVADRIITQAMAREALIDFVDEQSVRHRLYAIAAQDEIKAVETMMQEKFCVIADGHHRYTTGLKYMRESGNPRARYQMIAFTNTHQKGLVVLATHRVVGGLPDFKPADFLARLAKGFRVEPFPFAAGAKAKTQARQKMLTRLKDSYNRDRTAFGIYMGTGSFYVAALNDPALMVAAAPDKSPAWRALDLSVLHKLLLEQVLGLDEEKMGNADYVEYVKDLPHALDEIIRSIETGRQQIAFFTNPLKMRQLTAVTEAGERMPHKSTYFYPKMYTGLTIQKL